MTAIKKQIDKTGEGMLNAGTTGSMTSVISGEIDWSTLMQIEKAGTNIISVPNDCDRILIFAACGAGAGGGGAGYLGASSTNDSGVYGGGGGESGASITMSIYSLADASDLMIAIGKGGAGGAAGSRTTKGDTGSNGTGTALAQNSKVFLSLKGGSAPSEYYMGGVAQILHDYRRGCGARGMPIQFGSSLTSPSALPIMRCVGGMGQPGLIGLADLQPKLGVLPERSIRGAGGHGGGCDNYGLMCYPGSKGGDGYICFAFIRKTSA